MHFKSALKKKKHAAIKNYKFIQILWLILLSYKEMVIVKETVKLEFPPSIKFPTIK